jgi:hypothetical protein
MATLPSTKRILAVSVLAGAAFGVHAPAASAAELLAGIASNGRLVVFSSDDPSDVEVVQVSGLEDGERLVGLDVRPATGDVYALGSTSRLYVLDVATGEATAVGAGPFTPALSGSSFGFDFNPTVDRIRIVSDSGQNLRAHPDTGVIAFTDTSLAYATLDSSFGTTPEVTAAAYTNNDTDPATGTTLYDIDAATGNLVTQLPPNDGTLNTVGPLDLSIHAVGGFDIAASDGTAYAAITPERSGPAANRRSVLYTIDLVTGEATKVGKIGGPKLLTSLTALGSLED